MSQVLSVRLKLLAQLFLKLGFISFGGPAAHIALMEEEVVKRRGWLTRSHFLDLLGATNLIPGPNSTEMAIHVGYSYAGFPGLIVAGICFIFPAVLTTAILAWVYQQFGTLPQVNPLLYGIKPVVIAIIFGALWRLGQKAIKNRQLFLISIAVVVFLFAGLNEVISLLLGGILGMVWLQTQKDEQLPPKQTAEMIIGGCSVATILKTFAAESVTLITPSLAELGLFFLKIGCVLFGSGYVLIAFLEGELVNKSHWLTQQQLLDAIAIGQFTPGPVLSTATFIGYLILGIPGAIVATLAIFIPSFFFVAALNPIIPKLRQSKWTASFLDAINVSAIALMAVVTLKLAYTIFMNPIGYFPIDFIACLITLIAAFLILRFKINAAWLVLGGAILGEVAWMINPS